MILRGLIFDLDDTLTNSAGLSIAAYQHAFKTVLNRTIGEGEIRAQFGPSEEGVMRRLTPEHWEACIRAYHAFEAEHMQGVRAFEGIPQALELLRARGVRMGIVTGRGPVNVGVILRKAGIEDYFAPVRYGDMETQGKEPAMREILAGWGLRKEEAAYLGDSESDMLAAREVGIAGLRALWAGEAGKAGVETERFERVEGFLEWVKRKV